MKDAVNKEEGRSRAALGSTLFHAALLAMLFFYVIPSKEMLTEPAVIRIALVIDNPRRIVQPSVLLQLLGNV